MIDYDLLALTQFFDGRQDGCFGYVMSHQVPWTIPIKIEVTGAANRQFGLLILSAIQHLPNSIALGYYLAVFNGDQNVFDYGIFGPFTQNGFEALADVRNFICCDRALSGKCCGTRSRASCRLKVAGESD